MKLAGLSLMALLLMSGSGFAANRPYTPDMPCRAIAGLVRRSGAVLLSTGPGIFDRYVDNQDRCGSAEALVPSWVTSLDSLSCFVGYTCEYPYE